MFYPRSAELLEGTKYSLTDLREFLDKNSGVKIYRDDIRVKPYGSSDEPEGDWLGLAERRAKDPAGIGRKSFKVAVHQLVGAIFVSRDENENLIDSSGREGLIQGHPFDDLKALVLACVGLLEAYRHEQVKSYQKEKKMLPKTEAVSAVKNLSKETKSVVRELNAIAKELPREDKKRLSSAIDKISLLNSKLQDTAKSVEELASQAAVFRGLATIGIASAVFGHETQSAIDEFVSASYAASRLLKKKPDDTVSILDEINKAIKYAGQISSWGAFALARVQGHKRKKQSINIKNIIESTINEVDAIFKSAHIKIQSTLDDVEGKVYIMEMESILLNLLTNAYYFCLINNNSEGKVKILLKSIKKQNKEGFLLTVADSGIGIADDLCEKIWTPLFSTKFNAKGKSIGTGLGLTIVQSILEDIGGTKSVDNDPQLKGARFKIWIPLE